MNKQRFCQMIRQFTFVVTAILGMTTLASAVVIDSFETEQSVSVTGSPGRCENRIGNC